MSTDLDYSQEPEKIYKASLIKHQNEIYYLLFMQHNIAMAWQLMLGWIGTFNPASQEVLGDISQELEDAHFRKKTISEKRTFEIWRTLSKHVFNAYLSQSGFGMVQTATLPKGSTGANPPKKKAYNDVKATL